MKKLNILTAGFSFILLFSGCHSSNQNHEIKEISEEEFATKLESINPHNYSEAKINATEKQTGTGDFTINRDVDRQETYIYYPDTGAWLVKSGDSLLRRYIYNFASIIDIKSWVENEFLTYKYKYYSDLTVKISESGTFVDDYGSFQREITQESQMTINIDNNGYLTSMVALYNQSIIQTSEDSTLQGTRSGHTTVNIIYKN